MEKITFMMDNNETVDFYVMEETRISGVNYLLVTDSPNEEDEEADAFILKDTSKPGDEEALYEFVEDNAELEAVGKVFSELLEDIDLV